MSIMLDVDGTLVRTVPAGARPAWRLLERAFPFVKVLLPGTLWLQRLRRVTDNHHVWILTASENRVGTLAWLKLRGIKHRGVIFCAERDKPLFYASAVYLDADEPGFVRKLAAL